MLEVLIESRMQLLAIAGSLFLLLFILRLIKRRKLREDYALLWLLVFFLLLVFSVFLPLLKMLASFVGILYAPAALLLFLILGNTLILVHYSTVITKLSEQNKTLIQELALLKEQIEKWKPREL